MNVTRMDDEVLITIDVETAATLAATIHFLGSPAAGPYRQTMAARDLRPLANSLCEAFGFPDLDEATT